jgi:hypothetical protein
MGKGHVEWVRRCLSPAANDMRADMVSLPIVVLMINWKRLVVPIDGAAVYFLTECFKLGAGHAAMVWDDKAL